MHRMAESTCPLTGPQVVDLYFMEQRAKLLDIAAFLDRLDRACLPAGHGAAGPGQVGLHQRAQALLLRHPELWA
jgi:hypothetical protein